MDHQEIADKEWMMLASRNECFDLLSCESEEIYSEEDGVLTEQLSLGDELAPKTA